MATETASGVDWSAIEINMSKKANKVDNNKYLLKETDIVIFIDDSNNLKYKKVFKYIFRVIYSTLKYN